MKTIIIFTISILFANFSFAQDSETLDTPKIAMEENSSFQQTQSAMQQLRNHINKEVAFPVHLKDAGIEGTTIVEFIIDKNGKITKNKIVKSMGTAFDTAILNALKNLKTIDFTGSKYAGKTTIHVPVRFAK